MARAAIDKRAVGSVLEAMISPLGPAPNRLMRPLHVVHVELHALVPPTHAHDAAPVHELG